MEVWSLDVFRINVMFFGMYDIFMVIIIFYFCIINYKVKYIKEIRERIVLLGFDYYKFRYL